MPVPAHKTGETLKDLLRILKTDSALWVDVPPEYRFSAVTRIDTGNVSEQSPRLLVCSQVMVDVDIQGIGRRGNFAFDSTYGIRVYVYDNGEDSEEREEERDYLTEQVLYALMNPGNRSNRPIWSFSKPMEPTITYNHIGHRCFSTIRFMTKVGSKSGA